MEGPVYGAKLAPRGIAHEIPIEADCSTRNLARAAHRAAERPD